MKRFSSTLAMALALGLIGWASLSRAETSVVTTEKTTYTGVVSEVNPTTSTIILKSDTGPAPVTYTFDKGTIFVDSHGNVVSSETIRNAPVTVEYTKDGDRTIVTRVIETRPTSATRTETTTTHTEAN
jgi:hypothetical protein